MPARTVVLLDLLINRYRNKGLPMIAVTTPTGTPVDPTTLPMQSQAMRKNPPNAADAGIRYRLSDPRNILIIWGATSPTKPITPV